MTDKPTITRVNKDGKDVVPSLQGEARICAKNLGRWLVIGGSVAACIGVFAVLMAIIFWIRSLSSTRTSHAGNGANAFAYAVVGIPLALLMGYLLDRGIRMWREKLNVCQMRRATTVILILMILVLALSGFLFICACFGDVYPILVMILVYLLIYSVTTIVMTVNYKRCSAAKNQPRVFRRDRLVR